MSPLTVEILVIEGKSGFSTVGASKVSTSNGDIALRVGIGLAARCLASRHDADGVAFLSVAMAHEQLPK